MNPLRITICQQPLAWENRQKNLDQFENLLSGLKGRTDLVILPEMFTTGFTMNATALAEPLHGSTFQWMRRMALELRVAVTGSFICSEPGIESEQYFNRLLWMNADGTYHHYDKRHLFSFAGEHFHFSAGRERLVTQLLGWRICPLICYDLRFPVWSRNNSKDPFDLLIYVANWPEARANAWKDLLVARAHENQCYVAGVNRIGTDGNGVAYSGDSCIVGPRGERLGSIGPHASGLFTLSLDGQDLVSYREKFRALDDADHFSLHA
jgi:omega-amidase